MLDEVIETRRNIGDPSAADFIIANELPENPLENTAYTTGNGEYKYFDGVQWRNYALKFSDNYIGQLVKNKGKLRAAIRLIDQLIARLDPEDYINSGNSGGQSVGFASLSEVTAYYEKLRDRLLEQEAEEAGMNSGLMLQTVKRPVGGVLESYE